MTTGIYWFSRDLRLADQPGLFYLMQRIDRLICVYTPDEWQARYGATHTQAVFQFHALSEKRQQFMGQTVAELAQSLAAMGQTLLYLPGDPVASLSDLIERHAVEWVVRSRMAGYFEQSHWRTLRHKHHQVRFEQSDGQSLFDLDQLPFELADLPSSFTPFRKRVEPISVSPPLSVPKSLPPPPDALVSAPLPRPVDHSGPFAGGESAARRHLDAYMTSPAPQTYKQTRNALDNWAHSTKCSPWLAVGALSPRTMLNALQQHEHAQGVNESTYWILFELLWREYFHWYALAHGRRLFHFEGVRVRNPLTSFYPQRFKSWQQGRTPYPIVNACMNQLRQTGYMSNRGRQLVASCLVHELQVDWRYGAVYFEQQLLDYDLGSNWGNWQYLAGVGADPRGHRRFDLDKQTAVYDPEGDFIARWQGEAHLGLVDSVDGADWPL